MGRPSSFKRKQSSNSGSQGCRSRSQFQGSNSNLEFLEFLESRLSAKQRVRLERTRQSQPFTARQSSATISNSVTLFLGYSCRQRPGYTAIEMVLNEHGATVGEQLRRFGSSRSIMTVGPKRSTTGLPPTRDPGDERMMGF